MPDYQRIAGQTAWVYILTFFVILINIVLRSLYANKLTLVDYGLLYGLIAFFNTLIIVREFGINYATSYFAQKYIVKDRPSKVKTLYLFNLAFQFTVGIVLVALLFLLRGWIITHFYHNEGHINMLFMAFLFWWLVRSIHDTNITFFNTCQEQKYAKLFEFLEWAMVIGFSLAGFALLADYRVPAVAFLLSIVIVAVFSSLLLIMKYRHYLASPLYRKKDIFNGVFRLAFMILPAMIAILFLAQTDMLAIQYFSGAEDVAYYSSAFGLASILLVFVGPLITILSPLVTNLWHKKDKEELSRLLSFIFNHLLIIILPLALFFFVFSDSLILFLLGAKFLPASIVLKILCFFFVIKIIWTLLLNTLWALGKPENTYLLLMVGAALNIVLSVAAIHFFGIIGVAIGTSLSYLIMMFMCIKKMNQYIPLRINFTTNTKIVVSSLVFILMSVLLKGRINVFPAAGPVGPLLDAATIFLFAGLLYLALLFILRVLSKEKLVQLKKLVSRK